MASRAEAGAPARPAEGRTGPVGAVPALPVPASIGSALRTALSDFYYHSWRLLPANVLWAVASLLLVAAAVLLPILVLLLPLAALPLAGIFAIATRIVRGESVSFWDGIDAWRRELPAVLGLGTGLLVAGTVLAFNVVSGILAGTALGIGFSTLAFWGLAGMWIFAWLAWPVLLDPARTTQPARDRLRLAGLLLLAHPVRVGALGFVLAVLILVGTVAVVALVTVAVAFAALVASRVVLSAADRLEASLAGTSQSTRTRPPAAS